MKKVLIAVMLVLPLFVVAQYTQGPIESLEGTGKLVLTFDDGPSEYTADFLDALKAHKVQATFFVMGNKITEENMPILRRIIEEGHILANHNWTHERFVELGIDQWKINYEKSVRALVGVYKQAGVQPNHYYFRAPFGWFPEEMQAGHKEVNLKLFGHVECMPAVGWSVKSADWRATQFAKEIFNRILWQVADPDKFSLPEEPQYTMPRWNGGVLLAHDAISLRELVNPAKGLRPPTQIVETLKAVKSLLGVREKYGFEVANLDEVEEFQPPRDIDCSIKN